MVDEHEPCMVALLQVCDYDGEPGISHAEWQTCFPSQLEGIFKYSFVVLARADLGDVHRCTTGYPFILLKCLS